jgi:dolichyl-phosphate beta-glucosyltransferase
LTPLLSVIIPAHNEERRLPGSLRQLMTYLAQQTYVCEVIVVENASTDRTVQVVHDFMAAHANLHLLEERIAGKGLAVRRGMLAAQGEYRFICDADLSMPVEELARFLPPLLTDFDIAIGSRETRGAARYHEPAYRHLMGRIFNCLVRKLAVPGIQDTQAGFKCFRGPVAEKLFQEQTIDGWSFDVEVLFLAQKHGYRIVEVPISWYFDSSSRIHPLRDSVLMVLDLFRIRINWLRGSYGRTHSHDRHPDSAP